MHSIYRILIFFALFIAFTYQATAQTQDKEQSALYMEQAELIMSATQAVDDALDLMVIAANFDTTSMKANFEAGNMHLFTTGKARATKYFLRVYRQNPNYRFDLEYLIGQSYQYGLEFDKAIEFYDLYKARLQANPSYSGKDKIDVKRVDRKIYECNNGKEFVANPSNYSIVNLGREINSEFDDYAPVLAENEDELVFTSRRKEGNTNENVADDNKPFEDIFISTKIDGKWSKAKNISNVVNTPFNDSNLALSADGKTLFIYKDLNDGDIYFSKRQPDGTWATPEPLPGEVNSNYRETSVSLSKDGNTLYFASDRLGGLGGSDIYMATKNGVGEWTKIKNLGPNINSEFDEDSPFIDYDNTTLYFSSQGRKGMGGFDIFKSTLVNAKKNEWTEAENLGYPMNTPEDDIFYVGSKDGERGYYSSIRDDGMGYSDIYVITTPKGTPPADDKELLPLQYEVNVKDSETKEPIDAKVKLFRITDNMVSGFQTEGPGKYIFAVKSPETDEYNLSVESEGYAFQNFMVEIRGASEFERSASLVVLMKRLEVGMVSVLRNIYFDYGKATFQQSSYNELNKLESMLKENEGIRVEISGHTDNVSSADFNMRLSLQRANAVKEFLVSKGIDPRRVTTVGYGEERPIASNDDEEDGRELNRRVEFKVLDN
ncbi:MAG: OmpA family protein [Cyclobacteriaceae bacterium]|nr:OmpA family protein [Cyclobacteriaceae bacterium]